MSRPVPNLVLIGFAGAGKTTVGKTIAEELGRVYVISCPGLAR
jgi:shikimate kinase